MSRTPRPNKIKELHGTRPSRMNDVEVPVLPGPLVAPDWLPADARAVFDDMVPKFAPEAVAVVDSHALGMFAQAVVDYRSALERVAEQPFTLDEHGTPRRHPANITMEAAASRLLSWARELGATPAARARMSRVKIVEREVDPAARLLTFPPSRHPST